MTRSHVLLHCRGARIVEAREKTWEGKTPGGVRLLAFLEHSGVGRVMDTGADWDQRRGERMDRWIVWEAEERDGVGDRLLRRSRLLPSFVVPRTFSVTVQGDPYPEICAQRTLGAEDFYWLVFFRFSWCVPLTVVFPLSTYPLGMKRTINSN